MRTFYGNQADTSNFVFFPAETVTVTRIINDIKLDGDPTMRSVEELKLNIKPGVDTLSIPGKEPIQLGQIIQQTNDGKTFITNPEPFFVYFTKEPELEPFRQYSFFNIHPAVSETRPGVTKMNSVQISKLTMRAKAVQVFENGSYFHPYDILLEGYMGWEKIADLLPFDYTPER
jgi:hypothetical protein